MLVSGDFPHQQISNNAPPNKFTDKDTLGSGNPTPEEWMK